MRHRIPILLTSILKPVNDTRMFEKFGLSLSQTNKYEVNIIGFEAKNIKKVENVRFYPVFNFERISFGRLLAPLKLLRYIVKVKPSIIIFNSPETLYVILLYKLFFRCRIVYDIQENYYRNIVFNKNYIPIFKDILGSLVRLKEWSGLTFIDHAIFAEEGYKLEMPYWSKKAIVIRNTYTNIFPSVSDHKRDKRQLKFIYSGTISKNYGIFNAIKFIDAFYKVSPYVSLLIAGYCANHKIRNELKTSIAGKNYIELVGGDYLVPHDNIIHHIQMSDFGLVCYDINPSVENCFPTKIYEYMANKVPIIVQNYKPWSSFCLKYDAALEIDFENVEYDILLNTLSTKTFFKKGIPNEIFWQQDEKKLIELIENIRT